MSGHLSRLARIGLAAGVAAIEAERRRQAGDSRRNETVDMGRLNVH